MISLFIYISKRKKIYDTKLFQLIKCTAIIKFSILFKCTS